MSVRTWSLKSFGVKIGFWTLLSALILIQGSENKIRALAGNQCPETICLKIWASIFLVVSTKKMEPRKFFYNVSADWLPGSALILFWGPKKNQCTMWTSNMNLGKHIIDILSCSGHTFTGPMNELTKGKLIQVFSWLFGKQSTENAGSKFLEPFGAPKPRNL